MFERKLQWRKRMRIREREKVAWKLKETKQIKGEKKYCSHATETKQIKGEKKYCSTH